eukprot:13984394-Alexandrium_andersonii.AAC.1
MGVVVVLIVTGVTCVVVATGVAIATVWKSPQRNYRSNCSGWSSRRDSRDVCSDCGHGFNGLDTLCPAIR